MIYSKVQLFSIINQIFTPLISTKS